LLNRPAARPAPSTFYAGRQLKFHRAHNGISQPELAQSIGRTYQQIQKYENGTSHMSVSTLYAFSRILGVPVTVFFPEACGMPEYTPLTREKLSLFTSTEKSGRNAPARTSPRSSTRSPMLMTSCPLLFSGRSR